MFLTCPNCEHSWNYRGNNKYGCQCSHCRTFVKFTVDIPDGKYMSKDDVKTFAAVTDESLEQLIWVTRCERARRKADPKYRYNKGDTVKNTFERMKNAIEWGSERP